MPTLVDPLKAYIASTNWRELVAKKDLHTTIDLFNGSMIKESKITSLLTLIMIKERVNEYNKNKIIKKHQ